jgi:hypothetical protein
MIGVRLTEGKGKARETFEVVGRDGSRWAVARVDCFGPVEALTAAEIEERFSVEASDPSDADPQAGWEALSEAHQAVLTAEPGDPGVTPEVEFRASEGDRRAALEIARSILADGDKRAEWDAGTLGRCPRIPPSRSSCGS